MKHTDLLIDKNDRLIRRSIIFLIIACIIFLGWGYFARLESASISSGEIIVQSKRKSIQHLEGGIVSEVYVHEGQHVDVGTPLIKLSDIANLSRLKQTKITWISYELQYQRLKAERDNELSFKPEIDSTKFPNLTLEIETLIANQQALFTSRVDVRNKELNILESRLDQAQKRRNSAEKVVVQKQKALSYLNNEIQMHDKLLVNGYTSRLQVLELKRSAVLLQSEVTSAQGDLEDANSSITELEQQKLAIRERNRSDIENQITDIKSRLVSLRPDLDTANDIQTRKILKSPTSGIVMGMKVNTPGEIVNPGETIMEIVPSNDNLVVEALLKPTDIDVVKKGQDAIVRLSAYNSRTTPTIHGKVIYVDADRAAIQQGDKTVSGYKIKIQLDKSELENNPEIELYPGMPAEVYVLLKEKRPIDYLLEPFKASLFRAFRES